MSNFHRFVDPTWTGYVAIPLGPGTSQPQPASGGVVYDRVNIVSGATGGGGTAFANPPPLVGPTPFTYWVGFDDPGYSANVNRGFKALGENTDFLDDVVHQVFGVRESVFVATPLFGPAINSYTFPPGSYVWLGSGPETFDDLFTITNGFVGGVFSPDAYFIPALNDNLRVVASTSPIGSGFVPGPVTVTFNGFTPTPPFSGGIFVNYRRASNLALITPDIHGPYPNGIDGAVARFLYRLDGKPEAYAHSTWYSGDGVGSGEHSLWQLNHHGLNQMLLRNTDPLIDTVPAPISYMTPNAANAAPGAQPGFWGERNYLSRHSPMMVSALSQLSATFEYFDPLNALWSAWIEDKGNLHKGGSSGFVVYGQRRMTYGAHDTGFGVNRQGSGYSSFLHTSNHPMSGIIPGSSFTFVGQDTAAVLLNAGADCWVILSIPDFWAANVLGEWRTSVAKGYDLVEIQLSPGAAPKTYVIVDLFSGTVAMIQNMDGTTPTFLPNTPCTIRWRSMVFGVSDGVAGYDIGTTSKLKFDGLFYAAPHQLDTTPIPTNADRNDYSAKLYASNETGKTNALAWGGFRTSSLNFAVTGKYFDNGVLRGDGAVEAKKVVARDPGATTTFILPFIVTLLFGADAETSDYNEYSTVGPTTSPIVAITFPSLNVNSNDMGRVITWVIRHDGAPMQIADLSAWPGNYVFENLSDCWFSNAVGYVDVYTGLVTHGAGGMSKILMSVKRYNATLGIHHVQGLFRVLVALPVDPNLGGFACACGRERKWRPSSSQGVHGQPGSHPDAGTATEQHRGWCGERLRAHLPHGVLQPWACELLDPYPSVLSPG